MLFVRHAILSKGFLYLILWTCSLLIYFTPRFYEVKLENDVFALW